MLTPFSLAVVLLSGMNGLLTRLWRLGKPFQWRFLNKGESHEDTIRKVREETGLTVKVGRLLKVRSGRPTLYAA